MALNLLPLRNITGKINFDISFSVLFEILFIGAGFFVNYLSSWRCNRDQVPGAWGQFKKTTESVIASQWLLFDQTTWGGLSITAYKTAPDKIWVSGRRGHELGIVPWCIPLYRHGFSFGLFSLNSVRTSPSVVLLQALRENWKQRFLQGLRAVGKRKKEKIQQDMTQKKNEEGKRPSCRL